VGTAEDHCRARPRHQKKTESCFVIVNASLAGIGARLGFNELQDLRGVALR
jgi:hypothetical protein